MALEVNHFIANHDFDVEHPLTSATIPRRDPTPRDVKIEILYCGICHSALHYARNEWSRLMQTVYPCVPGHEIVGRVTKVGSAITKFKSGDLVGHVLSRCRHAAVALHRIPGCTFVVTTGQVVVSNKVEGTASKAGQELGAGVGNSGDPEKRGR
jgi:Zn-dependent alcohol dehydrogenase